MGGLQSGPSFSLGQIRDAQNRRTPDAGTPREGDDAFGDFFVGVEEDTDLDAPAEFEKLASESNELKAQYARREEELNSLRASSEKMLQEWANFVEQIERRDALVGQLREEIAVKDAESLELRQYKDSMALERDALRGELTSTQNLLLDAKEEAHKFEVLHAESAVALSSAKSEDDELISSYRKDAAAANARPREISNKAELKLARALTYAQLEARRQAFEEVHAKGFDLSTEIEEAKALEEELAAPTTSDEGSSSSSGSSEDEGKATLALFTFSFVCGLLVGVL
ncbi:PREDICTED: early endosome antigen 1-like [Nicotiana attenuata]|uniref:early endosome antigen 1-like n=1 Tax=Nicotiana attenuata TaxID=49451 RepID=UPI000904CDB0|nr:PREDICTED: early endosome antigen 1-like [Nicotiana attenuata]